MLQGSGSSQRIKMSVRGAEALSKVYEMFDQLSEPLSDVDFPSPAELAGAPDSVCTAVEIAREAFQLRCPVEKMRLPLLKVDDLVRTKLPQHSPECRLLRRWSTKWLGRIETIDPLNSRACLQIQLAPSLLPKEIEEEQIDEGTKRRYVRLPLAIINNGPGPAFNINVQLEGGSQITVVGPPKAKVDLATLDPDKIEVATFRFWQMHDEEISVVVKVTYDDFTRGHVSESKPFTWPPLAKDIQGPIHNPFVIGRPVGSRAEFHTLFRGRDDQLRKLRQAIHDDEGKIKDQGTFIFIRGLRRTGKTSLILQFREQIRDQNFLLVYMDCLLFEQQIALAKEPWSQERFLREVAGVVAATASVELPADRDVGKLQEFEGFLQFVQERTRCRLILVFDEADAFGREAFGGFAKPVLQFFNKLKEIEGFLFVFVHELTNGFWEKQDFPHEQVRVELLEPEDTKALATEVMPDLIYTPLALRYLWMITGGYPFLTQLVCHHLVEELNERRDPEAGTLNGIIEIGDIKRVVAQIILSEDDRPQIDYLRLGFSSEEKQLLLELARADDVDAKTGLVRPVKVAEKNGVRVQIRNRDECESEEEHKRFHEQYGTEQRRHAFQRLLTKEVLDRTGDREHNHHREGSNLRLRVGFLWLYLHELQRAVEEVR